MYVPLLVEKVRVKGAEELFLVTHIDWNHEKAHLISLKRSIDLEVDVPFADILPVASINAELPRPAL